MSGWFDTHAHLSDAKFDADRDDAIRRAAEAGVDAIVEIADGPDEWPKARSLADRFPDRIDWAAGLHPYYADQGSDALFAQLETLAAHPRFRAVGEIGLDYAKCPIPRDVQIRAFRQALDLALRIDKPVIIHCRDAYADLLPVLEATFGPRPGGAAPGVVHCFSGTAADAERALRLGFYLGVDAPITYPSAGSLRDALSAVPADRLVLETDAPYLPPQSRRGKRNEPAFLPETGARLAELLSMPLDELRERTTRNARTLFRRDRV